MYTYESTDGFPFAMHFALSISPSLKYSFSN